MKSRTALRILTLGALAVLAWAVLVLVETAESLPTHDAMRVPAGSGSASRGAVSALEMEGSPGAARNLGRGAWQWVSTDKGPSMVDELLLLVTFDWTVDDVQQRFAGRNPRARRELAEGLLATEPRDEDTAGAEIILACMEKLGLEDEETVSRLYAWADRESARQLARRVSRVLMGAGAHGREAAARLARSQWARSLENPEDRVSYLCASYVVEELRAARAPEAVPYLEVMAKEAVDRAYNLAWGLENRVQSRLKELAQDEDTARVRWDRDPTSKQVAEMWEWRHRAQALLEAMVAVDSEDVAAWADATLRRPSGNQKDQIDWMREILVDALHQVLPDRPGGPVAVRLKPWILERLHGGLEEHAQERSMVYRVAGIYGDEALPALIDSLSSGRVGSAQVDAVAGLAQAVAKEGDGASLPVLREFLRGDWKPGGSRDGALDAQRLILEAISGKGEEEDLRWIQDRAAKAPPAEIAMMLEFLPDSAWESETASLVDVLQRMEPLLATDSEASSVVDLALERLLGTANDPRDRLRPMTSSTSQRLAEKCKAAVWRWTLDHEESVEVQLELLVQRYRESLNPFRRTRAASSLWETSVALAKDPAVPVMAIASEAARMDVPLGMRVAMSRALALRGSREDFGALETTVPVLVQACHDAVNVELAWARRFELGHWKTIAWLAVSGNQGRSIARAGLDRLFARGGVGIQPLLRNRLSLLARYLDAMEDSGWGAYEKRLHELSDLWNQGGDRDRALAQVRVFCSEVPPAYLEGLTMRRDLPFSVRCEAVLALSGNEELVGSLARTLAASLFASAWRDGDEAAVESSFSNLIQRGPDGRKILEGVLADLRNEADPRYDRALSKLAGHLGAKGSLEGVSARGVR